LCPVCRDAFPCSDAALRGEYGERLIDEAVAYGHPSSLPVGYWREASEAIKRMTPGKGRHDRPLPAGYLVEYYGVLRITGRPDMQYLEFTLPGLAGGGRIPYQRLEVWESRVHLPGQVEPYWRQYRRPGDAQAPAFIADQPITLTPEQVGFLMKGARLLDLVPLSAGGRHRLEDLRDDESPWRQFARRSLDLALKAPHLTRPQRAARIGVASPDTLRRWEIRLKAEERAKNDHR
jgi:hypothetical protein